MEKVDKRREKIYAYILERMGEGTSPTVREICERLNIPSTSTVHSDLKYLAGAGLIEMTEGLNRTIRMPGGGIAWVPLIGEIAADTPVLDARNIERYIPVACQGRKGSDMFALRVKGDSMAGAAILDGDIVVVERVPSAGNGVVVAAATEAGAVVRRAFEENGRIRLQPENDACEPVIADKSDILGRVTAVMRYF